MRKLLLLLPVVLILSSCSRHNDSLVSLSSDAINGVVQIVNLPDEQPTPTATPSPTPTPSPSPNITPAPAPGPYGSDPRTTGPEVRPTPSPSTTPSPTPEAKKAPGPDKDPEDGEDPSKPQGPELGTGFIIAPNLIVTNYHVIGGEKRHYVVYGHNDLKKYVGHLIAGDKDADIAIMRIDEWDDFVTAINPPILHWGSSRNLQEGQPVWAIGHPYGLTWTLTDGIVSRTLRRGPGGTTSYFVQTNTSINPGNSGGPLFNTDGAIIGINTEIVGSKGYIGLSIPSDYASKVVEDLQHGGKIKVGIIGINMAASKDQHHVAVGALFTGSNSIAAGLLPNDVILQIRTPKTNGWETIKTPEALQYETKLLSPGDIVDVYALRDGHQYLKITFQMADPNKVDTK